MDLNLTPCSNFPVVTPDRINLCRADSLIILRAAPESTKAVKFNLLNLTNTHGLCSDAAISFPTPLKMTPS